MLVAWISRLHDNRSWDPEIRPLSTLLSCWLVDLLRSDRSLPILWSASTSRHFETFWWHSWWSRRCYLHVHHSNVSTKQNLPLAVQELSSVPYRECKHSGIFSDVLMAANLTDELISDTCAATRPFSASATHQTLGVIALAFFKWIWPLQHLF